MKRKSLTNQHRNKKMYLQTDEGEEVALLGEISVIKSDIIRGSHDFEGFVPQYGKCRTAGRAKQKVTLFCLISPKHRSRSQVVRSLWIVGNREGNNGRTDSGSSPAGKNKK